GLGVSDGRPLLGSGERGILRGHPPQASARPGHRRRTSCLADYRAGVPGGTRMIISRAPLRISLGGGGTDLPSYYREHGGFVLSAAIDKYVYITVHETFRPEYLIKYSQTETVQTIDEIRHPIIREALRMVPVAAKHLEIVS